MVSVRNTSVTERSGRPAVTTKGNARGRTAVGGAAAQEGDHQRSKRGWLGKQLSDFGNTLLQEGEEAAVGAVKYAGRSLENDKDKLIGGIKFVAGAVVGNDEMRKEGSDQVTTAFTNQLDAYGEAIKGGTIGAAEGFDQGVTDIVHGNIGKGAAELLPFVLPGSKGAGSAEKGLPKGNLMKGAEGAGKAAEEAGGKGKAEPVAEDHVPPKQKTEKEKKGERQKSCSNQPVVFATGAKALYTPEFAFGWTISLALYRNYASDLDFTGPLGRNRIGPLDETIVRLDDGKLLLQMGSGLSAAFATPTPVPGHVSRNAKHPHLKLAAGERRSLIVKAGGLSRTFCKYPDGVWRLASIADRNGNRIAFERDRTGLLERLDHPDGLALAFVNDAVGRRREVVLVAHDGTRRPLLAYDYDAAGNMVVATNRHGTSHRYCYDEAGRLTGCSDGAWMRSTYRYDDVGRVSEVVPRDETFGYRMEYRPADGQTRQVPLARPEAGLTIHYDDDQNTVAATDGLGCTRRFDYDCDGQLTAVIDAAGNRTTCRYDDDGNVAAIVDPAGRESLYYWSGDGDLQIAFDGESNRWLFERDENGNLVSSVDPLGHRTDIVNDATGQPTGIMRHDGLIARRRYDAHHRLVAIRAFCGSETRFERDSFGRVTAVVDPLGKMTRFVYEDRQGASFWQPSKVIRPDGVTLSRAVDAGRAEVKTTDGEGRSVVYRYGTLNLLEEIGDANGGRLRLAYDHDQRLIRVTNQKDHHWHFERDAAGRVIREVDVDGLAREYGYGAAGELAEIRHADGARLSYARDPSGLVVEERVFAPGAALPQEVTRFAYDGRGLLVRAENNNAVVELERDRLGNVIAEVVNGRRIDSVYDCCGNRVERRIGDRVVTTTYDPSGLVKTIGFGSQAGLAFDRDQLGRETRRLSQSGFCLEQGYDDIGQLLDQTIGAACDGAARLEAIAGRSYRWDKCHAPLEIADRLFGSTTYAYDSNGQIVEAQTRWPEGSEGTDDDAVWSERFAYDAGLDLVGVGGGHGEAPVLGFAGRQGDTRPDLSSALSSSGGRMKAARGPDGEKILLTYDRRGRVVERCVERNGWRPHVWKYGWDVKDRLVSCRTPEGEDWAYGYDPFGRRVWKVRHFSAAEKQLLARRFPELVEANAGSAAASHEIEAAERRLNLAGDAEPPVIGTSYLWDGDVLAEEAPLRLDGTSNRDDAVGWHFEPGSLRPLARQDRDGIAFIVTDHLGTPREIFDEAGNLTWAASHGVWGKIRRLKTARPDTGTPDSNIATIDTPQHDDEARHACPLRFQGQYEDAETGLYYNRFRHYDPIAAQYTSPDPIGINGGTRPHAYVATPTAAIDPLGLMWAPPPMMPGEAPPPAIYREPNPLGVFYPIINGQGKQVWGSVGSITQWSYENIVKNSPATEPLIILSGEEDEIGAAAKAKFGNIIRSDFAIKEDAETFGRFGHVKVINASELSDEQLRAYKEGDRNVIFAFCNSHKFLENMP